MTDTLGDERTFELVSCGCDCWYCTTCCLRKGFRLRAELIPILETFTGIMMLTLTIDPELFASPRKAYLHVFDRRGLSRLMRELDKAGHLHSRRYFYVIEFQRKTEQAHFHVLIDATFVPKAAIDAAWSKLRPKSAGPPAPNRPAFGMARYSVRRFAGGAEHAASYATKYLLKTPEHGWPAWVIAMGEERRVPRYGTSRGLWGREPKPSVATGKRRMAKPRSYAQRVSECGSTCNLFESLEAIDVETGEVIGRRRNWIRRLNIDSNVIALVADGSEGSRRYASLNSTSTNGCIAIIARAAGHPVRVIA